MINLIQKNTDVQSRRRSGTISQNRQVWKNYLDFGFGRVLLVVFLSPYFDSYPSWNIWKKKQEFGWLPRCMSDVFLEFSIDQELRYWRYWCRLDVYLNMKFIMDDECLMNRWLEEELLMNLRWWWWRMRDWDVANEMKFWKMILSMMEMNG